MTTLLSGAEAFSVRYNQSMAETFQIESWDSIHSIVKRPLLLSVTMTGLITLLAVIFYFAAQPVIPIFYSLARAEQTLTTKEWLFIFPGISLVITVLHIFLIAFFKELDALVLRLFAWMTMIMQLILTLTLVRIILITM